MDESKILIIGANGQLGKALHAQYPNAHVTNNVAELDITDEKSLQNFNWSSISTILNASGYTNVDGAETTEGRVVAWRVNATGVANLANLANSKSMTLIHISTDYVFDGTKIPHTEDEPLSPLSSYGASKAAGDVAVRLVPKHYLVRTSWIIGDGGNFVRTMLGLGKKGVNPAVVSDQIGRPTFTSELARAINHLLQKKLEYGVYNMTNDGQPVSWANLAREIFKEAGLKSQVTDITSEEYFASKPGSAKRPLSSEFDLSKLKAADFSPRDWQEDIKDYTKKEMQN